MFSQRQWKILFLGSLGIGCAIAFNACTPNPEARQPSLGNQTVATAQAPMTGTELNERLLSVLPAIDQGETNVAAAQTWTEPTAAEPTITEPSTAISASQPATSLSNPEPVPTARGVAPALQAPAPVASTQIANQAPITGESLSQRQALAFSGGNAARPISNTQFGHYPYAEAYRENLTIAGYYGSRAEQLHGDAAQAFQQMVDAAQGDGVEIIPVSGFRDRDIQAELFSAQTARQGSPALAARISAPPGHSEHHTGFAIDVGDRNRPETDIEISFEQTPAFRWMAQNAASYGFELSFPRNNAQGISYEPWHWRFVGTSTAQQVFAQAR